MPQRDNFDVARVLLAKAIEDEVLVQAVVENTDIGDAIVGFHGQQAMEKLAKAVLTAHGIAFAKTHDLDYLINLVEKNGIISRPVGVCRGAFGVGRGITLRRRGYAALDR